MKVFHEGWLLEQMSHREPQQAMNRGASFVRGGLQRRPHGQRQPDRSRRRRANLLASPGPTSAGPELQHRPSGPASVRAPVSLHAREIDLGDLGQ